MAFPFIDAVTQEKYELVCAYLDKPDVTPQICGLYGRACRQMDSPEGANRALCTNCPLAAFASELLKDQ
mgnify:FL=1